jgi:hypothetical protein
MLYYDQFCYLSLLIISWLVGWLVAVAVAVAVSVVVVLKNSIELTIFLSNR